MKKISLSLTSLLMFALAIAVPSWSESRLNITKEEFRQKVAENSKKLGLAEPDFSQVPGIAGKKVLNHGDIPPFPAYKDFKTSQNNRPESSPQPESLCDEGFAWMGGEAWTSDTDGTALVCAAGGNFYFASVEEPDQPVEINAGDIGLRVRIHNHYAYFFSWYYTYQFDITDPLDPVITNYGPGAYYGFTDACPTTDDSYLIMADDYYGDLYVWDLAGFRYLYAVSNPNGGWYINLTIVEDKNIVIMCDWYACVFDFYDISDLACQPPELIGTVTDFSYCATGMALYKNGTLYGSAAPWQWYSPHILGNGGPINWSGVSMFDLPDAGRPGDGVYLGTFEDTRDITSIKSAGEDIMVANYQGRVATYKDRFTALEDEGFFKPGDPYPVYDACYSSKVGAAACGFGGLRFFDSDIEESSHYPTGSYASDVVTKGDYLYVPSGQAGLLILDNTDPTAPSTYSSLETGLYFDQITLVAVSDDENYCYVSDGSDKVWVVDISDKKNPFVVSTDTPYTLVSGTVTKLLYAGGNLLVGTTDSLNLVDVSTNPAAPALLDSKPIYGEISGITSFTHPSYPGRIFLGVTAFFNATFYTFRCNATSLTDTGSIEVFGNLSGVVVANSTAYVINWGEVYPIAINGPIPFSMSVSGTPLYIGYSSSDHSMIAKVDDTMLAAEGDDRMYGYGWPAVFLIDIATDPMAPALLPPGQLGVLPFDYLTNLASDGHYVYYSTGSLGTGAFSIKPDFDMPTCVSAPVASPITPFGRLQGMVKITAKVKDDTSAITRVIFRFNYGGGWIRLATFTNPTPAGSVGTYTYNWDIAKWPYSVVGTGPIRVEFTDSGCNTAIADSSIPYMLNLPPTYEIIWEPGCEVPPTITNFCDPPPSWIVCGDLGFTIQGYENGPNDPYDITQLAYNIDKGLLGPWILYDIPVDGTNPLYLSLDTTTMAEGPHTLNVRVADAAGLRSFEDINGKDSWTFTVMRPPGAPVITDGGDVAPCTSGIQVTYTPGDGATRHDLYMDGVLVLEDYVSGATFYPGNFLEHEYFIRAVNTTCACVADSETVLITDVNDGPPSTTISSVRDGEICAFSGVTVEWYQVYGATGYDLLVDGTTTIADAMSPYIYEPGDANSHSFQVRAKNALCTGPWSPAVTGTDDGIAAPAIDTVADKDACAGDGVIVTWSPVSGATSYDLLVDGATTISGVTSPYTYQPGDNNAHSFQVRANKTSSCPTTEKKPAPEFAECAPTVSEFNVPTPDSFPVGICSGPDGNIWFIENLSNKIGKITTYGLVTEFSVPTPDSYPQEICAGPDGNLWFTEMNGNKIGRITTAGVINEFPVLTAGSSPLGICAGPDGNLWFTEWNGNNIGRITTSGVVTEFPVITAGSNPVGICTGPDGNLWFTEGYGNNIGRITTSGSITEFPVPTSSCGLQSICSGPDGNIWFLEWNGNNIGKITTDGVVSEFQIPSAGCGPVFIASGFDGSLWFTESNSDRIGRMTMEGVFSEFAIPTAGGNPLDICSGPDGNLWFTIVNGQKIGRITSCPLVLSPSALPCGIKDAPYSQTTVAGEGTAPYTYEVTAGELPPGLNLNPGTGEITGSPTTEGVSYDFTVTATDSTGRTGYMAYTITITMVCAGGWSSAVEGTDANGTPSGLSLISVVDNSGSLCDGVLVTFTEGSPAAQHDLYMNGSLVHADITSPYLYPPGDNDTHTYFVRAVNGACYSDSGTAEAADLCSGCTPPAGDVVITPSGGEFSWTKGADNYRLLQGLRANLPNLLSGENDFACREKGLGSVTTAVSGDTPGAGVCYYYIVQGYNGTEPSVCLGTPGYASGAVERTINLTNTCP